MTAAVYEHEEPIPLIDSRLLSFAVAGVGSLDAASLGFRPEQA